MLISEQVAELIIKSLVISFLSGIGLYFITSLWDVLTDTHIPFWIVDFAMTLITIPMVVAIIGFIVLIIKN